MKKASKEKILIIDDEADVVFYLQTLIEDHGYFTVTANDASTGFATAQKELPDLICLDIMMPKKSGLTLYKEFKQDEKLKDTPVVIISGIGNMYSFKDTKFKKFIQDTNIPEPAAFFEKPLNVSLFFELLSKIFDS